MGVSTWITAFVVLGICYSVPTAGIKVNKYDDLMASTLSSDPEDCHSFYTHAKELISCPEGMMFDPVLRVCVEEDELDPCNPKPGDRIWNVHAPNPPCTTSADVGHPICANCSYVGVCLPSGPSSFAYQYYECIDGQSCNEQSKPPSCQDYVPQCQDNPFQCGGDGMYPDTHDCSVYHTCKDKNDTIGTCSGTAFNPGSQLCDAPKNPKTCNVPIAICDKLTPSTLRLKITGDCLGYYMCTPNTFTNKTRLAGTYFSCPDGQAFIENTSDKTKSACSDDMSKVKDPQCLAQLADTGVVCFKAGVNTRPGNQCPTKAYYCSFDYKTLVNITCPDGQSVYNGACYDFTSVPGCKNICENGETMVQNPDDCTTYFKCDSAFDLPKVTKCGGTKAFNNETKTCEYNVPRCHT